jgi:hypothetical protein
MRQLIIIFEFHQSNLNKLPQFKDMIRRYGSYAFITNNSCIIWTNDTDVMVRDYLKTGIGPNDKIFVGNISAPAAWVTSISQEVTDYIIKNLK